MNRFYSLLFGFSVEELKEDLRMHRVIIADISCLIILKEYWR